MNDFRQFLIRFKNKVVKKENVNKNIRNLNLRKG